MSERFSVDAVFRAIDRVTLPVQKMTGSVGKFTHVANKGFKQLDRNISNFNRSARNMGGTAAIGVTALTAAMGKLVMIGAEFDDVMVGAASRFNKTAVLKGIKIDALRASDSMKMLNKSARELGRDTEFTASQGAGALDFFSFAGFTDLEAVTSLPGVANFATATAQELTRAADIATDMLGIFDMLERDIDDPAERSVKMLSNLTKIMDVMGMASLSANLTVDQLFESMKQGGPVGEAVQQSLATVATSMALIASSGIKGQKSGVALKNILLAMNAPNPAAQKLFSQLGVETADPLTGKIHDFVTQMESLDEAFERVNANPDQRIKAMNVLFGKIPIPSALIMIKQLKGLRALREEIMAGEGVIDKLAEIRRQTALNKIRMFWSAVQSVILTTFSKIRVQFEGASVSAREWVLRMEEGFSNTLASKINHFITNFKQISETTATVLKFAGAWIAVTIVLKMVVLLLTVVNLLMVPLNLTIAIVVTLGAAMVWLVTHIDDVSASFRSWGGVFKPIGILIDEWLIKPLQGAIELLNMLGRWGGGAFYDLTNEKSDPNAPAGAGRNPNFRAGFGQFDPQRIELNLRAEQGTSATVTKAPVGTGVFLAPSGDF